MGRTETSADATHRKKRDSVYSVDRAGPTADKSGLRQIPNRELTPEDIPALDADYYDVISEFALTFNGYDHYPETCGDIANHAIERYRHCGAVPDSLSELRACLFCEQRRWRHLDEDLDVEAIKYIHALVDAIRAKVAAGNLD
jgi:hypothetical protein